MKESEVLEKFELFKNGLIKKNTRIEELETEVSNLKQECSDKSLSINQLVLQNEEKANAIEQLRSDYNNRATELENKYNDLKEKTYKTIKHLVEDVIEAQEKKIADLQKEITRLENRKEKHDTTEDVDVMMTKIHTTDVDKSAVDETMESIKRGEKLFKQYSFGVANKETVKMFETFIHNIYQQAPLIGRFYILNNPFNCMNGLDKDACASLLQHLIQERIVETRGEEYISQYLEEDVIKEITKEC
jgi:DNA repair exonuclease SbcCD ATPase subunit